jgi:Fe-S-cluster containining protein
VFAKFGMIEDFFKARNCGANILAQKEDGSCIYLDGSCCSIHENKPKACRKFFCTSKSKKFKNMVKLIESKRFEI